GPTPRPDGILPDVSVDHSAKRPLVVMLPTLLFQFSVIHRLPSGPGRICVRTLSGIGAGYWLVITPPVVMRTVWFPPFSLNQIAPSGPEAIPEGVLLGVRMGYSVITPAVVIRPILLPDSSVNHMAPSGPTTILRGPLLGVGITYSLVITP